MVKPVRGMAYFFWYRHVAGNRSQQTLEQQVGVSTGEVGEKQVHRAHVSFLNPPKSCRLCKGHITAVNVKSTCLLRAVWLSEERKLDSQRVVGILQMYTDLCAAVRGQYSHQTNDYTRQKGTSRLHHLYLISVNNFYYPFKYFNINFPHA